MTTFGVIRFPGSCDEVDALQAARRVGEAKLLWHKDRDLGGVEGVDLVARPGEPDHADHDSRLPPRGVRPRALRRFFGVRPLY